MSSHSVQVVVRSESDGDRVVHGFDYVPLDPSLGLDFLIACLTSLSFLKHTDEHSK